MTCRCRGECCRVQDMASTYEKRRMNGEKWSTDGNGREGRGCGCGVSGVFRECDRVVRNMMEGMELSRMSGNGARASEMDST